MSTLTPIHGSLAEAAEPARLAQAFASTPVTFGPLPFPLSPAHSGVATASANAPANTAKRTVFIEYIRSPISYTPPNGSGSLNLATRD